MSYQILAFITHGKTKKAHKILFCIRYSRLSEYILKKHGEDIDKPSIQIYLNKIANRVTFKIKNGYSLELLTPGTMKLLGSTKDKINKD